MNLTQTQNILTVNDTAATGYSNVYILQRIQDGTTDIGYIISANGGSFNLTLDGYYLLHKFQITTIPNNDYYISGNKLYNSDGEVDEFSINSLLYIEDYDSVGIAYDTIEYINYYNIEQCYINLLKEALLVNPCCNQTNKDIINTLTMGIEVIKYLVEYSQYMEASRIISMLCSCSNLTNTNCNCNA